MPTSRSEVPRPVRRILGRRSYGETTRVAEILRKETVGGFLLVGAAFAALVAANSPLSDGYEALRDFRFGYEPWELDLTLGHWASDGLLAVFFFLVGLELKREFVAGDLRSVSTAVVPVAAAVGGVLAPALIYVAVNAGGAAMHGWAIPTATDIAFAVAVLAVIGSSLPSALRLFLLTLAVVDDLIAITIIAVFYTDDLNLVPLLIGVLPLALFALLAQRHPVFFGRRTGAAWLILLPIGIVFWALVHASGVHATIAGVLLGFTIPVLRGAPDRPAAGLAELFEHRFRPLSTGVAVPVFAFMAAGVAIGGRDEIVSAATDPVTIGIVAGLVAGKPLGIMATTWIVTRVTRAELDRSVRWIDLLGVSLLAGIGFTVSLLIAELSFGAGSPHTDHGKIGILTASVLAALLASSILLARNRRYKVYAAEELADEDSDGIPDVYQRPD
ncbi:Na+/H+ antiporter NhaA [Jiangella gansuensis]|uniref:Na+/H+ antiporter NhaA n=1 Tax=Jiangella gansuensis TaxID=281473 RepID=UPI0004BB9ED6|nr:Na+/H+ antiporter NhaA [Jiangella gansuensis]